MQTLWGIPAMQVGWKRWICMLAAVRQSRMWCFTVAIESRFISYLWNISPNMNCSICRHPEVQNDSHGWLSSIGAQEIHKKHDSSNATVAAEVFTRSCNGNATVQRFLPGPCHTDLETAWAQNNKSAGEPGGFEPTILGSSSALNHSATVPCWPEKVFEPSKQKKNKSAEEPSVFCNAVRSPSPVAVGV